MTSIKQIDMEKLGQLWQKLTLRDVDMYVFEYFGSEIIKKS